MPGTIAVGAPLGATTTARKWKLEVDTSPTATPNWVKVMGVTEFTPTGTAAMEDDADYDGEGAGSSSAVGQDWGATLTIRRAPGRATPTMYDPGQEFLRLKADKNGTLNTAHIRYFEYDPAGGPLVEAYEGYVAVAYTPGGGGPRALSTASLTLTGQGVRLSIPHPAGATQPAPTISGFEPGTWPAAGGVQGHILGSAFTGATAVTVGGVAVPVANWDVVAFDRISLVIPAKVAGAQAVIVTTPSGASAAVSVTYV